MAKKAFHFSFTVGNNYSVNGSVATKLNLTKRESIMEKEKEKKKKIDAVLITQPEIRKIYIYIILCQTIYDYLASSIQPENRCL
jgi:hypothetical protein